MARKPDDVAEGLKALFEGACPAADTRRNISKPTRVGPAGMIILRDGDPGDPDVVLSPLAYTYEHEFPVEVAAYETGTRTREEVLSDMLTAIDAAIQADRTLGGRVEWMEPVAPETDDGEASGAEPFRWADLKVRCTYTTSSPLA